MLEKLLKKIIEYSLLGFAFNVGIYTIKYLRQENLKKFRFKKENRIILKRKQKYSRKEIIDIGRQAIRSWISNRIMTDPVVNEQGLSIEKAEVKGNENLYENRMLREFIQQLTSLNNEKK